AERPGAGGVPAGRRAARGRLVADLLGRRRGRRGGGAAGRGGAAQRTARRDDGDRGGAAGGPAAAAGPGLVFGLFGGSPYRVQAQGLSPAAAGALLTVLVVAGIAVGPALGGLAGR